MLYLIMCFEYNVFLVTTKNFVNPINNAFDDKGTMYVLFVRLLLVFDATYNYLLFCFAFSPLRTFYFCAV